MIRIVNAYHNYDRERLMPRESIYEKARIFVRAAPGGKAKAEPYYFDAGKGTLPHWWPGDRLKHYFCENYEAGTYGHVYCRNPPETLPR